MDKIREIADKADMIVNGYAFTEMLTVIPGRRKITVRTQSGM